MWVYLPYCMINLNTCRFRFRINFQISKLDLGFQINSNGFSRDRNFKKIRLQTQLCLRQWVWLFIVICPQGGFFLIIRFPNLESSAWGTKFSSGPVEQTGIVGICLHLLLEDNPIPLMGGRLYPPQSLDPIDLAMFRRAFTCDEPTDRFSQVRLASISRLVELQI